MKKTISMLLAVCMIFSMLPVLGASAGGGDSFLLFSETFESADSIARWTFEDNDGEGNGWISTIGLWSDEDVANDHFLVSASYVNDGAEEYFGGSAGVQTPDNLAITPEIEIPAGYRTVLTFNIFAVDSSYAAEKFTVYYETEELGAALYSERLDETAGMPGKNIQIDLTDYAGTTGRIVFRHHDTTDQFAIGLDDVMVYANYDEEIPDFIDVTYSHDEITTPLHQNVEVKAFLDLHSDAEDVKLQWYVAKTPNAWGEAIEGQCESILCIPTDEEGTWYYRCHVTCRIGEEYISTPTEEFKTIKVTVSGNGVPSMFFDDVKISDWFYGDIEFVYYNLLMNGTDATHFGPNIATTRGMIVTVLYRMEGSPIVNEACPFTDVAKGSYYEDAITWAAKNGIVNGMGDNKYAPDALVTREQLAAIFCRYSKTKGVFDPNDCAMLTGFADRNSVSSWADEAMSWCVGTGLIGGYEINGQMNLVPGGNALRCQFAAILHRFCNNFLGMAG